MTLVWMRHKLRNHALLRGSVQSGDEVARTCRAGAGSSGAAAGAAARLPRLAMPSRGSGRQPGGTPQDSARRTPTNTNRGPSSPQSPGVLYVD